MKYIFIIICIFNIEAFSAGKKNLTLKESFKKTDKHSFPKFDIEGHRGCRGLMPENTIAAMLHALDLGVTTLEMDISISKDNKVLLSHEPFFNHEISIKPDGTFITQDEEKIYNLYQMNYDSIIRYDVGLKPHPRFPQQQKLNAVKPLLSDIFAEIKTYIKSANKPHPFFNIETKSSLETDYQYHPSPAEFIELLMKEIKENQMEYYVIIQSFDIRTLQYLHKQYPSIKTALLTESSDKFTIDQQIKRLGFKPTIYSPSYTIVGKKLVQICHKKHIKVIPWTVNSIDELNKLRKYKVDGIITDYPNLFH
jgi:glycerophosphoryl diester phosphodiesterase